VADTIPRVPFRFLSPAKAQDAPSALGHTDALRPGSLVELPLTNLLLSPEMRRLPLLLLLGRNLRRWRSWEKVSAPCAAALRAVGARCPSPTCPSPGSHSAFSACGTGSYVGSRRHSARFPAGVEVMHLKATAPRARASASVAAERADFVPEDSGGDVFGRTSEDGDSGDDGNSGLPAPHSPGRSIRGPVANVSKID
jgi:hypothetical protein